MYVQNEITMQAIIENTLKNGVLWNFHQFKKPFRTKDGETNYVQSSPSKFKERTQKEDMMERIVR